MIYLMARIEFRGENYKNIPYFSQSINHLMKIVYLEWLISSRQGTLKRKERFQEILLIQNMNEEAHFIHDNFFLEVALIFHMNFLFHLSILALFSSFHISETPNENKDIHKVKTLTIVTNPR